MPVAGFVLPSGRRWDCPRFHNLPGRLHARRQHMVELQIFAAQEDRVLTQTRRPIGIALARPRPAGCRHRSTCAISSRALKHSARKAAASSLPDIRHRMPGAVVAFFLATRSSCCLLPFGPIMHPRGQIAKRGPCNEQWRVPGIKEVFRDGTPRQPKLRAVPFHKPCRQRSAASPVDVEPYQVGPEGPPT